MLKYCSPDFSFSRGGSSRLRVYSCDLDNTLIEPNSGKFVQGEDDWHLLPGVKDRLKHMHMKGWALVIFTNQGGIEKKKITEHTLRGRLEKVIETLGAPVMCYASTGSSGYRKPMTGMWKSMETDARECDCLIDVAASIYVGDAAGRVKFKKLKKDFSCSDRLFAKNVGCQFRLPEDEFTSEPDFTLPIPLAEFKRRQEEDYLLGNEYTFGAFVMRKMK